MAAVVPADRILQHPALERRELGVERKRHLAVGVLGELVVLHRLRQVVAADAVVLRRQHRALDAVLELAHVARPRIRLHRVERRHREARHPLAVLRAQAVEEVAREQHHVVATVGEARQPDREHGEPVVQVLAEELARHQALEVAARRGDEPDVAVQLLVRADAGERALLEEPEQLHLHRDGEVADLVQEERTAVRRLGAPDAPLARVGEGALLVAEELGLDQGLWERGAVENHERAVLARREALERLGHQLLAGAAFAADEHRRLARGDLADLLVHRAHLAAVADESPRGLVHHAAEHAVLVHQCLALGVLLAADRRRLGHEVGDDLEELDVPHQLGGVAGHLAVGGEGADHLAAVEEGHADEGERLVGAAALGAVEEAGALADVADDLGLAGLRHQAGDALADAVAAERAALGVELAGRGGDPELVAVQEGESAAEHAEPALEDVNGGLEQAADVALARHHRRNLAQHRDLGL